VSVVVPVAEMGVAGVAVAVVVAVVKKRQLRRNKLESAPLRKLQRQLVCQCPDFAFGACPFMFQRIPHRPNRRSPKAEPTENQTRLSNLYGQWACLTIVICT
jgi:hypothetical protein